MKKEKDKPKYRQLLALSSLALMLPSSIVMGLFLGYILDKLFGTHPWMLIIFFILGAVSGFTSLIKGLNRYNADD